MASTVEYKYISKVGVELEGGWARTPPDASIYGDGSVTVRDERHIGEICSEPLAAFDDLKKFLMRNYPTAVNSSCGLHVHVSFKNNFHYSLLMSKRFYRAYLKHMTGLADRLEAKVPGAANTLKSRLAGSNSYCMKMRGTEPARQAAIRGKDSIRYHHLNFCFLLHGTVENRLFPMFHDSGVAVAAIRSYLLFVEEYIAKHDRAERGKVIEANVVIEPKVVRIR